LITFLTQHDAMSLPHLGEAGSSFGGEIMSACDIATGYDGPFIGPRPFAYDDRKYFFGRDDELNGLESQLKQKHFIAVVGGPGCGKSSLVSAGLRARLENDPDRRWCWVEMRSGDAPIRELALGLAGLTGDVGDLLEAWTDRLERILDKSSFGIGEALASISSFRDYSWSHVLLFIDQFEELFRFAMPGSDVRLDSVTAAECRDEATRFVSLLLTTLTWSPIRIHIVVTMNSDLIGRCASFYGLPEAVSGSQFLVPGMTRDQREDVICKPVQLAGGRIDSGLVQRALNDTNNEPDQLPNLQRVMKKCWERACDRGMQEADCCPHLMMDDYAKVGGLAGLQ
jgi:energy-coupling factor transporter ATP-binding protein EcfA2